jgi:hypothetical protein
MVHLTDNGRSLMDLIYPKHVEKLRNVIGILEFEEETILQNLLKKIGKQEV